MSTPAPPDRLAAARSLLFAPGHEPRKLRRALDSGAGAVIADLEDSVPADRKAAARDTVATILAGEDGHAARLVRVNGALGDEIERDLDALAGVALDAIVLPKATPAALARLAELAGAEPAGGSAGAAPQAEAGDRAAPIPVVAIVETAAGLGAASEIAGHAAVGALLLGSADLGAQLGLIPRDDGLELLHARSQLVVCSAAAGLPAPIDGVCLDFRDGDSLRREATLARSLGFGAKACIHPAQVDAVNEIFAPRADELDWARRVVEALAEGRAQGRGAVALDGQMVDEPIAARARGILAAAGELQP